MVQGELFREESSDFNSNVRQKSFLSRYQIAVSFDKLFIVLIANIAIFALTYSFGVEHGKRSMEKHLETLFPAQSQMIQAEPTDTREPIEGPSETVLLIENHANEEPQVHLKPAAPQKIGSREGLANVNEPTSNAAEIKKVGNFTIQLVTYDNEELAKREINRLKSGGHEGFVIPSGKFYQVCANYFESKGKARTVLEKFKESGRYPDAYIRTVIR